MRLIESRDGRLSIVDVEFEKCDVSNDRTIEDERKSREPF